LNEAYEAETLERQLQTQAIDFINDTSKNIIGIEELRLSQIFNWFGKDFTKEMSLKQYIRSYAKNDFDPKVKVNYMNYDWLLNGD
jgi:hypothetical protein